MGPLAPRPSVLVVHENRGLNPHIEDIARRLAVAGFVALAVDFLSPQGGTPKDEDEARGKIGELDLLHAADNGAAAVKWLRINKRGNGKVGAVGFCASRSRRAASSMPASPITAPRPSRTKPPR